MQNSQKDSLIINIPTVLIVDDNASNLDVLNGVLKPFYKVKAAINGELALEIASNPNKPDIILLDIMMPDMDGYEVCSRLKSNVNTAQIPIIFVTAKTQVKDEERGFEMGAVDYISKPISAPIVLARVKTHVALSNQNLVLEKLVLERTKKLQDTQIEIIRRLGCAAEYKDNDTGLHVIRMSWYSKFLAEQVSTDTEWINLLYMAAPMHDIGKIAIPDRILLKPGKLDDKEWALMKKHVEYGVKILGTADSELLSMAREITLGHHEQYDGSGYPYGIEGENIPLSARIIAIADAFDALTSKRPYKNAWPVEKAVALLKEKSGKHFDPILVPQFIKCLDKILEIKAKYQNTF
ncbi:MAG: two-component system response regulator [Psychromonas sp.]|nr:two-component system response regulator [Psychromonas sp.]